MKRVYDWLLTVVLVLGLCSCGQSPEAQWQEQYDLGVRYLSEGNYEEANVQCQLDFIYGRLAILSCYSY